MTIAAIDAHAHLSDPRLTALLPEIIQECRQLGIEQILLAGTNTQDWHSQLKLIKEHSGFLLPCFGLHPYEVAKSSAAECDFALPELRKILPNAFALGETGLDYRSAYLSPHSHAHQEKYFRLQLGLAIEFDKVPILHIVRAHKEAQRVLKEISPPRGFQLHAFNSEEKNARAYLDLGATLSIGPAILHPKNQALREAIGKIPLESLVLESDSPDQSPPNWPHPHNRPSSIFLVAKAISELKNCPIEKVLEQTSANFRSLFLGQPNGKPKY